jgi:hypothetical protein
MQSGSVPGVRASAAFGVLWFGGVGALEMPGQRCGDVGEVVWPCPAGAVSAVGPLGPAEGRSAGAGRVVVTARRRCWWWPGMGTGVQRQVVGGSQRDVT